MNQLGLEADALYRSAVEVLDSGSSEQQRQKAVEISDFLSHYGEELDSEGYSSTVDKLGDIVDKLVTGAGSADTQNVYLTGAGAFFSQVAKPGENLEASYNYVKAGAKKVLDDAKKELLPKPPPGGWDPWIIGGGILAVVVGIGYTVRAFR